MSVVLRYHKNGNEDGGKYVEVDGAKYVPDDTDPSKPKLDDKGEKVPFKAPEKGGDAKTLEELAKTNPEVAKLLDDKRKLEEEAKKKADEDKKKAEEDAAKNGQWQKLAEDRAKEIEDTKKKLGIMEEQVGKYAGSVKQILAEVLKTIPQDKLGLIPENFSSREKLEYITKNAKLLGATIVGGKGAKVNENDAEPPGTDLEQARAEYETILKKGKDKTPAENVKLFELSKKIKELEKAKK